MLFVESVAPVEELKWLLFEAENYQEFKGSNFEPEKNSFVNSGDLIMDL